MEANLLLYIENHYIYNLFIFILKISMNNLLKIDLFLKAEMTEDSTRWTDSTGYRLFKKYISLYPSSRLFGYFNLKC